MAESLDLVAETLEQFKAEHWGERIPVLSEAAQLAVKGYFDEKEMIVIAGSLAINEAVHSSMGTILSFNGHASAELQNFRDTIVGPYFLGDDYFPQGVAVWGLTNREGQSVLSNR